jgi:hypothetical protein
MACGPSLPPAAGGSPAQQGDALDTLRARNLALEAELQAVSRVPQAWDRSGNFFILIF